MEKLQLISLVAWLQPLPTHRFVVPSGNLADLVEFNHVKWGLPTGRERVLHPCSRSRMLVWAKPYRRITKRRDGWDNDRQGPYVFLFHRITIHPITVLVKRCHAAEFSTPLRVTTSPRSQPKLLNMTYGMPSHPSCEAAE